MAVSLPSHCALPWLFEVVAWTFGCCTTTKDLFECLDCLWCPETSWIPSEHISNWLFPTSFLAGPLMCQVTRKNKKLTSTMGLLLTLAAYEVANEYKVAFSMVMNNSATWIPLAVAAICVPLLLWGLSTNRKIRGIKWEALVSACKQHTSTDMPCYACSSRGCSALQGWFCSIPLRKTASCVQLIMKSSLIFPLMQPQSSAPISALPAL